MPSGLHGPAKGHGGQEEMQERVSRLVSLHIRSMLLADPFMSKDWLALGGVVTPQSERFFFFFFNFEYVFIVH